MGMMRALQIQNAMPMFFVTHDKGKKGKSTRRKNMTTTPVNPDWVQQAIDFHGHWCPGLAIGVRAAQWALQEMGRAPDEEIVAVVETDMCGVDAIQALVGCTFGKGNLIHKDYGKNAFTFYRRRDGKSARLVFNRAVYGDTGPQLGDLHRKMLEGGLTAEEEKQMQEHRAMASKRVMEADLNELFEVKPADPTVPRKARILASLVCDACKEAVMETRTRRMHDKTLCIPCFKAMEKR
jgi:formylmethanofuran dehydrogenase subunit E